MSPKSLLPIALGALLLGGCVSMGKYKALEALNSDLQSQLDLTKSSAKSLEGDLGSAKKSNEALAQEKEELGKQKSELEKQKDELLKVKSDLETQKAELLKVSGQLASQRDALQAEKDALLRDAQAKQAQYDGLLGQLQKEVNDGQLKITQYKNMLTVDVADKILFDSGKAALKPDGKAVLLKVGEALSKSDKYIRVGGHTDNVPVSAGSGFASNWELSTARATTVLRFLQDQAKLDPSRLIASGRGEYSPVAPNDTPANKQKNRRIEITLLDKGLVEAIADKAPSGASGQANPTPSSPTAK